MFKDAYIFVIFKYVRAPVGNMQVVERSVQEIGSSLLVTLPKGWTTAVGVRKGTLLRLLVDEGGHLSIVPEHIERERKRDVTITYDVHFPRRFFKEYFDGNERITILTPAISAADRKHLYVFLKRFMNLQIIEETGANVVVKCFRIDDLTMEECLERMFHLSCALVTERQRDPAVVGELRDTLTRFYYLLVMQIRRYLAEGKYAADKGVPIIRAMDYRMVAEKIQRIGEIGATNALKGTTPFTEYYARAFRCFMDQDFPRALPLWDEGNSHTAKIPAPLAQLFRYAREISMLVR